MSREQADPVPDNATALTGLGTKGAMWVVGWAIHRQGGAGIQVSKAHHRARKAHIRPQDAQVFMEGDSESHAGLEVVPHAISRTQAGRVDAVASEML